MGRQLAETLPPARELFDRANAILGYDLARICFEGPARQLDSTVHSQPALFVTSLAALEQLQGDITGRSRAVPGGGGTEPGRIHGPVFAGVMSFDDGLRLVQERGAAMQAAADATPSGMVAILGLDRDKVEQLCEQAAQGEILQVANLLCPGNIAVSGTAAACERIAELAPAAGAMKAVPLPVAGAFHTPIMQPAVERLTAALASVAMPKPRIPVISNVDAQPTMTPGKSAPCWRDSSSIPSGGRTRSAICLAKDLIPFTKLDPAACCRD